MNQLNNIIYDVLNSSDYRCRGYSISLSDYFLLEYNHNLFVVILVCRSTFSYEIIDHEYALYSISDNTYVSRSSALYDDIVSKLPDLSNISTCKVSISPLEPEAYLTPFRQILEELFCIRHITEDIQIRYTKYLEDLARIESGSAKDLYVFFESNMKIN